MGRASRIPYHQNVYDLLQVVRWEAMEDASAEIDAWEARTGRAFPASMREFYTTAVTIRTGGDEPRDWTLSLPGLWSEYSNDERAHPVPEIFEQFTPQPWLRIPALPGPHFQLIWENQGVWVLCARDDGSDDPVVDVSDACFFGLKGIHHDREEGWQTLGTFSEEVYSWFAAYYFRPWTPISYRGSESEMPQQDAPPRPYANGLWLRTPAEPFVPAVIDYLTELLGEPGRTPRPGNVTTYTFRPGGGTIRVTADEPGLGGALSAWWMHADTPGRLAELARLVVPFGTLRNTLRADTDPAREVLRQLVGERS